MEKRRFHRIRFTARCALTHNGITYHGQMENLSLNGALFSFSDGILVPKGDECTVLVFTEDEEVPIRLRIEVVYSFYTMLGTRFLPFSEETQLRLYKLVERVSSEPEKLAEELDLIRKSVGEYLS